MQENPLWPVTTRFPRLEADLTVDVAIIGGGIAGISCGYYLDRAGYNVAVLEQDEVGSAASGASSGILYYGTGTHLHEAVKLFGKDDAKMLWKESEETIKQIADLVRGERLQCGFRQPGAFMVAQTEEEKRILDVELAALNSIGIPSEIVKSYELRKWFTPREFRYGLAFDICAQIHPAIFCAELSKKFGVPVYENTRMESFSEDSDGVTVKTPTGTVSCGYLFVATNLQPFFGLEKYFRVESSALIVSQPLGDAEMKKIWPNETMMWTLGEQYDIIYPREGRNVLEVYRVRDIKSKLEKYYPGVEFVVETQWGDSWSKTDDWLPIIGKIHPRVYAAIAMGDQGVVMGFTAGRKATALLNGEQDDFLKLVSPSRFEVGADNQTSKL
ncbi:MAG: FAD-dependent oxidoreductase [Bacteroidota bacterium]